ncbi:MAG: agmatinase [Bacteroidales bacterium]|jgi:agmatinase|nr:agmatinase [Bacteroidales bacterium]
MTNYGGLTEDLTNYSTAEIVVVPVPYDGTSTWIKGADKGPQAILEASENMELYDIETDSEVYLKGIHTNDNIVDVETPEELAVKLKPIIKKIFDDKKFPVILGGEHSVSIGAFQAIGESFENISILQLDAHSDMRDEYEGSKFNHACVMARGKEICPVTQVGIRSSCIEEKENIDPERIFYSHDIKYTKENWIDKVVNQLSDNVYLTIDLDVLDPAFLPCTGTPEPDGLSYRDIINLIKKVIDKKNLVGMDVVELAPNEEMKASDFLASKLIYQILSYKFLEK